MSFHPCHFVLKDGHPSLQNVGLNVLFLQRLLHIVDLNVLFHQHLLHIVDLIVPFVMLFVHKQGLFHIDHFFAKFQNFAEKANCNIIEIFFLWTPKTKEKCRF